MNTLHVCLNCGKHFIAGNGRRLCVLTDVCYRILGSRGPAHNNRPIMQRWMRHRLAAVPLESGNNTFKPARREYLYGGRARGGQS